VVMRESRHRSLAHEFVVAVNVPGSRRHLDYACTTFRSGTRLFGALFLRYDATEAPSLHRDFPCLQLHFLLSLMPKPILTDLKESILLWRLWTLLGWLEVRQRYARSRLGPFWLTISMGVMIASIGVVYGTLFGQKMTEYLPFLAVSLVLWTAFSQTVMDGSLAYISSGNYIRQVPTPKLIYVFQVVWRNVVVLAHNFVIVIILFCIFGVKSWETLPLFVPALLLYLFNALWIAMVVGLLSARFRDLPQIIGALLQVAFYITPIIYRPNALSRFAFKVDFNPFTYLIDLVRAPLMGQVPDALTWSVTLGMAVVGMSVALLMTGRYLKRIPYWA
jgi:lipopolysaccharide transport system permease protein